MTAPPPPQPAPVAAAMTRREQLLRASAAASSSTSSSSSSSASSSSLQLVAAPFRSSADLQSRLSGLLSGVLPFPTALSELLCVFQAVDTALMLERNRGASGSYPASWSKLQPSVQRLYPKRTVSLGMVQQLLTVYPGCYTLDERHSVDKFGKLLVDYSLAFGHTNALGAEEDEAAVKASLMTGPGSGAGARTSTTSASCNERLCSCSMRP